MIEIIIGAACGITSVIIWWAIWYFAVVPQKQKKMEAEKIVESLECPGERDVMRMYYLSLKKDYRLHRWEEVAAKLGYTMRHTLRLHSDALEKIISR